MSDDVSTWIEQLCGVDDVMFGIDCRTRLVWRHGRHGDVVRWKELAPLPDGEKASEIYIHHIFGDAPGHRYRSDPRVLTMQGKIVEYDSFWNVWRKIT